MVEIMFRFNALDGECYLWLDFFLVCMKLTKHLSGAENYSRLRGKVYRKFESMFGFA